MASYNSTSATTTFQKPRLTFSQIINMSFGFFGIQFGWGLQMANMSAIYEYLGANPDEIPMLWLAAPLTGLLIQPIIGYMSDRTWHPVLGRRKPYFLIGAILSSIALCFMPNSSTLWMAAGLLWILDASINVSMEPFRAFVADMLPEEQHTIGFTTQSMFIGLGAVISSAMPFILTNWLGVSADAAAGTIPLSVKLSFYIGAVVFLLAVLYTVFTTKEYPPFDISDYQKAKEVKKGFGAGFAEIIDAIANMPAKMRQISLVQFFTWPGLFLMWFYFGVATTRSVFKYDDTLESYDKLYDKIKTDPTAKNLTFDQLMAYAGANQAAINIDAGSFKDKFGESSQSFMDNMKLNRERKTAGNNWGGICFAFYSLVTFLFSFILPSIANRLGKRNTHALCLAIGAFSLISVRYIDNQYMLLAAMMGVGIAWTSILSMPYAMLAGSIPAHRTGIYMGIFNFFIVLPEIIAALFFGWIMANILDNDRLAAVQLGGFVLLFASLLCFQIREIEKVHASV